jgi:hypothetical protein
MFNLKRECCFNVPSQDRRKTDVEAFAGLTARGDPGEGPISTATSPAKLQPGQASSAAAAASAALAGRVPTRSGHALVGRD